MGIGFDAGLKYNLMPKLFLGLMIRDITTTMMAWSTSEKEFVSPSLRPGVSYRFDFETISLYLQPSVDLGILLESRNKSAQLGLGIFGVRRAFDHLNDGIQVFQRYLQPFQNMGACFGFFKIIAGSS